MRITTAWWWFTVIERQWRYQTCISTWTDHAESSQPNKNYRRYTSASILLGCFGGGGWSCIGGMKKKIIATSVTFGEFSGRSLMSSQEPPLIYHWVACAGPVWFHGINVSVWFWCMHMLLFGDWAKFLLWYQSCQGPSHYYGLFELPFQRWLTEVSSAW